ncbi:MAG: hypothetical protein LC632_05365 [Xanthomonadaceae bacterium]|nr:hypothetical protein [Xanthomonadaceae bacterium]
MGVNMRLLVIILLCLPFTANAAPVFTVWAGFGHASVDNDFAPLDISDTGPRIGAHVDVGRWFGLELGWADFGSQSAEFTALPPMPGMEGPFTVTAKASAAWLAYAPAFTTESWVFGPRIGFARLSRNVDRIHGMLDNSNELLIGAFVTFRFPTSGLGLRLDAEAIGSDVRAAAVSVSYSF